MYSVTEAVRTALESGTIKMRLLTGSVPLEVPDSIPLYANGAALYVLASGPISDGMVDNTQLLSMRYCAACSEGDIGIGCVSSASLSVQIQGVYHLNGAVLWAQYGAELNGETVWLNLGRFTVTECSATDHSTQFTGYDAAYTLTGQYRPNVSSGATVKAVLNDLCAQVGLEAEQATLNMGESIQVNGSLSGKTCREMLGYLAGLCGKNAVITRDGAIRFVWYTSSGAAIGANDYYSGELSNGGVSSLAGIVCTVPGENGDATVAAGNEIRAIEYTNPYMTQTRLSAIWSAVGGYSYPVGSVGAYHNVLTEPGDIVALTNLAGVTIQFPCMQVELTFDGSCRCTLTSWGKAPVVRENPTVSPLQQQLEELKENTGNAMVSANGKNKVFHQDTAPTAADGLSEGDTWFDTGNDNRINTWTGSAWSAFSLGEKAIADLSITNAKIQDGTIQNAKIGNLDAGKITTGVLDADRIGANSITADKIDVTNLFAQDITCTNRFQLDTEFCKLETSGRGFALYVNDEQEAYGSGMGCWSDGLSLHTIGEAGITGDQYLRLNSVGNVDISTCGGSNLLRLNRSGGIWLRAGNGESEDNTVVEANRFTADSISEGGKALSDKYSKMLKVYSKSFSITVNANTTANGSISVGRSPYYTPIAVAGFRFPSTYSSYMTLFRSYLDENTYYWAARNHTSNDYTGQLIVDILYVEN